MFTARVLSLLTTFGAVLTAWGATKDLAFKQDTSIRYEAVPELENAAFYKVVVSRSGVPYVLTGKGVARLFDSTLALDHSFRPLASLKPLDIAARDGQILYLYDDQLLGNGAAGKFLIGLQAGAFNRVAFANDGTAMLAGEDAVVLIKDGRSVVPINAPIPRGAKRLYATGNDFMMTCNGTVYRLIGSKLAPVRRIPDVTAIAFRGSELVAGTANGYWTINLATGRDILPLQTRLPATNITCLRIVGDSLWVGTTRGAFRKSKDGHIDYYASRRWLNDDQVMDIQADANGDVFVLTTNGLNKIEFKTMTLSEKAAFFDRKIRERHIRFGFCSELQLVNPGRIESAEMIDTDNDGTWSNYYMASQAFRFAATRSEDARRNAWETFEALERLEAITGIDGFPARTFERRGYKFSDPDRWHPTRDGYWEWKGTTSSDEITAHSFGCAVMWECVAKSADEKARIARFYDRIAAHIVRNNLYLVDADGKPTRWGRWNPEYVNGYPHSIVDRRLNSAEVVGLLQFAYAITGNATYRDKAMDLLQNYGYLDNILSSMREIKPTKGYVYDGEDMGDVWNHSDDLLSFVAYWVLYHFALNDQLRFQYATAIKDHWNVEKIERCPLWSFIYASTGAVDYDLPGALWT
ncbi:MAG TPA: hypothetical protein VLU94_03130, partial [Candidatus Nitrosotalea sp.]|nr:hypothetical protein [Candidatus Nitrosotalea sp.]